jgi:hypothetical protein
MLVFIIDVDDVPSLYYHLEFYYYYCCMQKVIIFSEQRTPRLNYILDLLFGRLLGVSVELVTEKQSYILSNLPKINYSINPSSVKEIHIRPSGLLFERSIRQIRPEVQRHKQLPIFFITAELHHPIPFDLFSASFFLISRYEEYLSATKDAHGRFPAISSMAYQEGFLDIPLVQVWVTILKEQLSRQFPQLQFSPPSYCFLPTYDIDHAWAYRNKPMVRNVGRLAKFLIKGDFGQANEQLRVLAGRQTDPFDCYDALREWHAEEALKPVLFFLLGSYSRFDKNIPPSNPHFQELIRQLSEHFDIGIHPSYYSSEKPDLFQKEIQRLSEILERPIIKSRQHYLRFHLPETFRRLESLGIQEEYSMGYAAQSGFRASLAVPFPWYDLEQERSSALQLIPFEVMDVSLKQYMGLKADEALQHCSNLMDPIRTYGGTFCTLWHNSSFSVAAGWADWKKMYPQLLEKAR